MKQRLQDCDFNDLKIYRRTDTQYRRKMTLPARLTKSEESITDTQIRILSAIDDVCSVAPERDPQRTKEQVIGSNYLVEQGAFVPRLIIPASGWWLPSFSWSFQYQHHLFHHWRSRKETNSSVRCDFWKLWIFPIFFIQLTPTSLSNFDNDVRSEAL